MSIVNTEGFTYMMDNNLSDPWWRKNQRDNNENGIFDEDYEWRGSQQELRFQLGSGWRKR